MFGRHAWQWLASEDFTNCASPAHPNPPATFPATAQGSAEHEPAADRLEEHRVLGLGSQCSKAVAEW